MKIILKKDTIKELDTYSCAVYIALRYYYKQNVTNYYVSINQLCYTLTGTAVYSRRFKDNITQGLNTLIEQKLISIVSQISKTEYELNMSQLLVQDEFFIIVEIEYIRAIFNLNGKLDKFGLLKYLMIIVNTFNATEGIIDNIGNVYSNFVGYMPVSYLASECNISEKTALSYNHILEKNDILFIYRHSKYITNDKNEIKSIRNHYGFKKDEAYIIQFANEYELTIDSSSAINQTDQSSYNRKIAQKYVSFCKGKRYDSQTLSQLHKYCLDWNAAKQMVYDNDIGKGFKAIPPQYKDTVAVERALKATTKRNEYKLLNKKERR